MNNNCCNILTTRRQAMRNNNSRSQVYFITESRKRKFRSSLAGKGAKLGHS